MLVGLECWLRPGQAVANHHPTPSNKGRRPYVLQLRRSRRATLWVDTVALRTVDIGPCVADRTVRDATAVPTLLSNVPVRTPSTNLSGVGKRRVYGILNLSGYRFCWETRHFPYSKFTRAIGFPTWARPSAAAAPTNGPPVCRRGPRPGLIDLPKN